MSDYGDNKDDLEDDEPEREEVHIGPSEIEQPAILWADFSRHAALLLSGQFTPEGSVSAAAEFCAGFADAMLYEYKKRFVGEDEW